MEAFGFSLRNLSLSHCAKAISTAAQNSCSYWDGEKVHAPDQVLEVRWVTGRLHVARKEGHPDEWDPPSEPYDLYGPGAGAFDDVTGYAEAVTCFPRPKA
jgi:hypothetical protein